MKEYTEGVVFDTVSSGKAEVVEYIDSMHVVVRFVDTGYVTTAQVSTIKRGNIKDKLKRSVFGVGYHGIGRYSSSKNGIKTDEYKSWSGMLYRCYSEEHIAKHPTYAGVTVCEEWHNFQNFAEWMNGQDYKGKTLDKDILIKGNRVYSPDACSFVTSSENTIEAHAKTFIMKSPSGDVVKIYNMNKFCRENRLNQSSMSAVWNGRSKSHKGWSRASKSALEWMESKGK